MLYLNIDNLLNLKGVVKKRVFLRDNGFPYNMAIRLLNPKTQILNLAHLEKLCEILNCTPNDVLAWQAESRHENMPNHALHKLLPKPYTENLTTQINKLPLEKIQLIQQLLSDMQRE